MARSAGLWSSKTGTATDQFRSFGLHSGFTVFEGEAVFLVLHIAEELPEVIRERVRAVGDLRDEIRFSVHRRGEDRDIILTGKRGLADEVVEGDIVRSDTEFHPVISIRTKGVVIHNLLDDAGKKVKAHLGIGALRFDVLTLPHHALYAVAYFPVVIDVDFLGEVIAVHLIDPSHLVIAFLLDALLDEGVELVFRDGDFRLLVRPRENREADEDIRSAVKFYYDSFHTNLIVFTIKLNLIGLVTLTIVVVAVFAGFFCKLFSFFHTVSLDPYRDFFGNGSVKMIVCHIFNS